MTEESNFTVVDEPEALESPLLSVLPEPEPINKKEIFKDANYPYKTKMKRPRYEALKKELQVELLKMQGWVKETGQRMVIIF